MCTGDITYGKTAATLFYMKWLHLFIYTLLLSVRREARMGRKVTYHFVLYRPGPVRRFYYPCKFALFRRGPALWTFSASRKLNDR